MDDARLSRIEVKLDKLAEAVVSLARMEERMITLFKRMDAYEDRQSDLEVRVIEVEKINVGRGAIYRIVDKATWLIIGAGIAIFADYIHK
jgi:hypothetical protein